MAMWPQKSGQDQQGESGEALLIGDPSVMGGAYRGGTHREVSSRRHHFPLEAFVNYKAALERLG